MNNNEKIKKITATIEYYKQSIEKIDNEKDINIYWFVLRSDEIEDKKIKETDFSIQEKRDFLIDFYNYLAMDTIKQIANQK